MIIRNGSKWIRIISQRNRVSITTAVGGYSKDAHDSYSYYMIDKVRMRPEISGRWSQTNSKKDRGTRAGFEIVLKIHS